LPRFARNDERVLGSFSSLSDEIHLRVDCGLPPEADECDQG
jgi:hypothetical protein